MEDISLKIKSSCLLVCDSFTEYSYNEWKITNSKQIRMGNLKIDPFGIKSEIIQKIISQLVQLFVRLINITVNIKILLCVL